MKKKEPYVGGGVFAGRSPVQSDGREAMAVQAAGIGGEEALRHSLYAGEASADEAEGPGLAEIRAGEEDEEGAG